MQEINEIKISKNHSAINEYLVHCSIYMGSRGYFNIVTHLYLYRNNDPYAMRRNLRVVRAQHCDCQIARESERLQRLPILAQG